MELKTDPKAPITNQNTKILLKIGSVNGDALVDLPIFIRIAKHGVELEKTSPIVSTLRSLYIQLFVLNSRHL